MADAADEAGDFPTPLSDADRLVRRAPAGDRTAENPAQAGGREIWLGGNARPVAAAVVAVAVLVACIAFLEGALGPGLPRVSLGLALVAMIALAGLASAAALPRIERRGSSLRVRLAPLASEDLPLEIVECFFFGLVPLGRSVEPCSGSGSDQPDDPHEGAAMERRKAAGRDGGGGRRSTLIMRLAEGAREWRSRPSLAVWGIWRHGAIAFDGLWCGPLSPDVAADLTRRLVAARRESAVGGSSAADGKADRG
jgi:hypothetical protein